MAEYGYGYTRKECIDIASDYAVQLGKRTKDNPLSLKWIYGFLKRWPELKVLKPRAIDHARAKMASRETISNFYHNLKETLTKYEMTDKPHLIYNIDEKGVTVYHKPPFIVAGADYCPSSVTSGKGQTITIIGCGNAAGQAIPPFYIFPGQRMKPDLLNGAAPGSNGTVSETGWSNGCVFRSYLEQHFLKFTPLSSDQKKLLILDGHKSHVSVGLTEWALEHNIIIFVLPPHCSHILQPLDIGCFGPFQKMYDSLCHRLMRQASAVITRYNVCEVASKAYMKSVSAENLTSSFRRAGIYPFNEDAVPSQCLIPAEVFQHTETETSDSQKTVEGGIQVDGVDMLHRKKEH
ncbi:uncharacterized protein LOC127865157 [Dreissena polymorpha]|uniref:uncharacterized protein LOC127865157 n=1 Tax=Dreissena polymorpha TaxID=45954 RepID=UPI0022650D20|nr:uncharacterized protein LOC127865157 [Dreissena polymorpha]